jgi:hypothetical protein
MHNSIVSVIRQHYHHLVKPGRLGGVGPGGVGADVVVVGAGVVVGDTQVSSWQTCPLPQQVALL